MGLLMARCGALEAVVVAAVVVVAVVVVAVVVVAVVVAAAKVATRGRETRRRGTIKRRRRRRAKQFKLPVMQFRLLTTRRVSLLLTTRRRVTRVSLLLAPSLHEEPPVITACATGQSCCSICSEPRRNRILSLSEWPRRDNIFNLKLKRSEM
jgi:hypothetical protein